jgi:hypothetical protein
VRVKLFTDAAGVVRDTEVVRGPCLFDDERCMLPDANDPPARFAGKAVLWPLRVGCRYTLITACLCLEGALIGAATGPHFHH